MRVLLDECIDSRIASHFGNLAVATVVGQGWSGISNCKLLAHAQQHFDVFVTVDRNLSFQQHLPKFDVTVMLVLATSSRVGELVAFVPKIIEQLGTAPKGAVTEIGL